MAYQKYRSENMQKYFESLPKFIQESIIQSGAELNTEQELATSSTNWERSDS